MLEPTERPSCSKRPESVGPVCSAVWSNPAVIPNRVGFVRLFQIGVFILIPSIRTGVAKPKSVMEISFQLL